MAAKLCNTLLRALKDFKLKIMNVEIISIGDELLIGQVVNTNSSWMAEELNKNGFAVKRVYAISDQGDEIISAVSQALERAEIVLLTGGLGPTKDDITKKVLMDYFDSKPIFNEEVYEHIKKMFSSRNYPLSEVNRQQAFLPDNCKILPNVVGTAAGMWFEKNGRVVVSMPGVPFEMKRLMSEQVIPRLKKKFNPGIILHKTIMTTGMGESMLAEKIEDWENSLPENIKLAYLPQPGIVRLRLSASGENESEIRETLDNLSKQLHNIIPKLIYGYDELSLEEAVGNELRKRNLKLATAESCTGGYIAHLITSIAGSSDYFEGSVVSYSNQIKETILGVKPDVLEKYGAVSQQVVEQMAMGVKEKFKTNYAVSTSGIAGPGGGTDEKPVGTVWIGVAGPGFVKSKRFQFGDHRGRNIRRSALMALNMLRLAIIENE